MVLVLIAVVVVAVIAGIVVLGRRPSGTDLDSVRGYHTALGTLEQLAERNGPTSTRGVGPSEGAGALHPPARVGSGTVPVRRPGAEGEVPPVPVRGNDEFPDPGTPLVFDDARPHDRYQGGKAPEGGPAHRVDRAQRHALDAMNHRPRRGITVAAVVIAVAVFAVLAYTGSKRSSGGHATGTSTPTTVVHRSHGSSTPSTTHTTRPAKPAHTPKPTPTTLPSTLVAASSTDTSATYAVPFATYPLTITTSAPSWVQITTVSTGSTLWAGTVRPGTRQVVQVVGEVTVEIGIPSVAMVAGTIPLVLPTALHTPFLITLQPPAPTAATSTVPASTAPSSTTTTAPTTATTGTGGQTAASATS